MQLANEENEAGILFAHERLSDVCLNRKTGAGDDTRTIVLSGEARYGLLIGNCWSAGPLASISYADAELGRVRETGANALNLLSSGADDEITRFGGGWSLSAKTRAFVGSDEQGIAGHISANSHFRRVHRSANHRCERLLLQRRAPRTVVQWP